MTASRRQVLVGAAAVAGAATVELRAQDVLEYATIGGARRARRLVTRSLDHLRSQIPDEDWQQAMNPPR